MEIQFRVQGADYEKVAKELAERLQKRFHVTADVRPMQHPASTGSGASAEKTDPLHVACLVVHVAIVGFEAYKMFVLEPAKEARQALINNWHDLVRWAKLKLPTTIRAVIGDENLLLHESEPEQLHELTATAIKRKNASVVVEPEPAAESSQ